MSDVAIIKRFFSFVKERGELVEVRADQSEGERKTRYHGYYNDHDRAACDAADFGGNVYFTVNRLDPSITATNELVRCRKGACTKAENTVRRSLLYLDGDPVRPTGTPSNDAQHQAAIDLVKFIAGQLPFPKPLIGDSGNGACAFWKIDLPPDSPLVKQVLKAIKKKWDTPAVTIDLTVASLSRIGRLLGTDNYKGGKAGRQSMILDAPTITKPAEKIITAGVETEIPETVVDGELELLTEAVMEAFAPLPKKQTEKARVQQLVTSWTFGKTEKEQIANVQALLDAKKIIYNIEESTDSRGTLCHWFRFATCPFRPTENDGRTWIKVHPTEGVSGGCFHAKCAGKGLVHILSVIAPELAAQAAEGYDDSHRLARSYLQTRSPLVIWQTCPYGYREGAYMEESEASIRAGLNLHVKTEFNTLGFSETPNVTTSIVNNVYQATSALVFDREEAAPHWLKGNKPPASEFLLFSNGVLHVPSYLKNLDGCFADPTPEYFALAKLPYEFKPNAPEPKLFTGYCQWQWTDANVHLLLEETLGDILLSDPRMRVFYTWLGKRQAGKSALAEGAVEGLVGEHNRCAVDLHDFAADFGLEGALGKKLILVSEAGVDVRFSSSIVEKIKRITGNDPVNIKRKFKPPLSLRLDTKILAVSNHLLKLIDDSGALFDRLVPLQFTRSIEEENVDRQFPLKLKAELPGIVLLALKGWKRLRENNGFTLPDSSKSVLSELRETGSPVLTFVEKKCQLNKDAFTSTADLFKAWEQFCVEHELKAGTLDEFVTAIKSAAPELKRDRQSVDGKQIRGFSGIKVIERQ